MINRSPTDAPLKPGSADEQHLKEPDPSCRHEWLFLGTMGDISVCKLCKGVVVEWIGPWPE